MRTALREVLVTVTSRVPLPRACMPTRSGLVGRVAGAAMAAAIAPARIVVPAINGTSEPFMQNLLFVDDGPPVLPADGSPYAATRTRRIVQRIIRAYRRA